MYNNKRDDFYFSGETILAYFDNGEWKEVLDKMKRSYEERLYTLSLCPLPAGDSILLQLNLAEYGSLRAGKYKIIKPLYNKERNIVLFLASHPFEV